MGLVASQVWIGSPLLDFDNPSFIKAAARRWRGAAPKAQARVRSRKRHEDRPQARQREWGERRHL